jgi:hypothetical protein
MALGNGRALEDLGKEAREENSQIHELTKKSTEDAAAVKVLTIMMLVYLPTTVVLVSSFLCLTTICSIDRLQEFLFNIFRGQHRFSRLLEEAHRPRQLVDIRSHSSSAHRADILRMVGLYWLAGNGISSTVVEKCHQAYAITPQPSQDTSSR